MEKRQKINGEVVEVACIDDHVTGRYSNRNWITFYASYKGMQKKLRINFEWKVEVTEVDFEMREYYGELQIRAHASFKSGDYQGASFEFPI